MNSVWLAGAAAAPPTIPVERRDFDCIVIGAGITGLTTAVLLARRGLSVGVLERETAGSGATGNGGSTVSLLQGTRLSSIAKHHSDRVVAAYALANLEGQAWLLEFCRASGIAVAPRDAVTFAEEPGAVASVLDEYSVARRIGLDVTWVDDVGLPFSTFGAVVMPDQFRVDPMRVVGALLAELDRLGAIVYTGVAVTGVGRSVNTNVGPFSSNSVVVATGRPFLDRGLYFLKTQPHRIYRATYRVDAGLPGAMFTSATRTLDGDGLLHAGGSSWPDAWVAEAYPGAAPEHRWSALDYHSYNEIPFAGKLPRGLGRIWFATGYDGWGMTNAPAAAQRIAAEILGDETPRWVSVLGRRLTVPADYREGIAGLLSAGLGR